MGNDNYLYSKRIIKNTTTCRNCIYKVCAKDNDTIVLGIGNIFSDMIIIPQYNIKSKNNILHELIKLYKDTTNKNLLEHYYVTRNIKCNPYSDYKSNNSNVNCNINLLYEVNRLTPKRIIIMGVEIGSVINRNFNCIYLNSPYCLLYDGKAKDTFIDEFKKVVI